MTEPLGGQPPEGSQPSVPDLEYQANYQRAFEAMLWGHPAAAIYRFRAGAFENLGARDNDILAYSGVATPKLEGITPNSATPYICAYSDLRQGPVVIDIPASGADGTLYGQVVDAWQFTIAAVGPAGLDQGQGGKYLFTPPGYEGEIPEGYLHVPSPNYRIALAFRSVVAPGKTVQDAYEYGKRMRMYFLSEADDPPEQRFIDPVDERYPTLPFYDERYIEDIAAIVSRRATPAPRRGDAGPARHARHQARRTVRTGSGHHPRAAARRDRRLVLPAGVASTSFPPRSSTGPTATTSRSCSRIANQHLHLRLSRWHRYRSAGDAVRLVHLCPQGAERPADQRVPGGHRRPERETCSKPVRPIG